MLNSELLNQLKEVLKPLESEIQFSVASSNHHQQEQLIEMLDKFITTHPNLSMSFSGESKVPFFSVLKKGVPTGISFKGIPNGHEFTSLILAVLNSDGKGKLPDSGIMNRISSLDEPLELKTFISLTCTNCPDVVQALNLFAINNPNISHTMVDGNIDQEAANEAGVQGVPSVIDNNGTIIHVGKSSLIELLEKLESRFKTKTINNKSKLNFDVVVIGGGPAGTSAAIYSARKGLKTAIVADKIGGQVRETKGIENLISQTYTEGPSLSADFETHLRDYDIHILENRIVKEIKEEGGTKVISIKNGELLNTPSLIFATGAKWKELNIPGEKEYLGRGVAYCPHCDGPFYEGKKVSVIGGGNSGVEAAIDLANLASEVTLLEYADELKADRILIEKLHSLENVRVYTSAQTSEVIGDEDKVTALKFIDRTSKQIKIIELDGIFVQIGLAPNSELLKGIVETSRFGEIKIDEGCRTSKHGIYAAGDVTTVPFKQIVIAMGEGSKAALSSFEDRIRTIQ